ncbi:MAG: AAA family ATPase [Isosphaeraceae bacterium]
MIEKASFRNFKSLRHVDVDLERLTVFVGPNASGKTSVLEGLRLLSSACDSNTKLSEILSGPQEPELLLSRGVQDRELTIAGRENLAEIRLTVNFERTSETERAQGDRSPGSKYQPRLEWKRSEDDEAKWSALRNGTGATDWPEELRDSSLHRAAMFRFDAAKLASPSYSAETNPRVGEHGEHLASVLAVQALNQPSAFKTLQERVRSIIPSMEGIRFNLVTITKRERQKLPSNLESLAGTVDREYLAHVLLFDFKSAPDIPASHASEGTLLVLALLTVMLGPAPPSLLLIDDLDRGLHPKAQRDLIPLIRSILHQNPRLQIVATTHSPYILDGLEPKEIRMTWAGEDGVTRCGRMDEHPDFERWKDEMWPGEFWSLVGEQWVAKSQPVEGR